MSSQFVRSRASVKHSAPVVLEFRVDLDADVDAAVGGDQVLELVLGAAPVDQGAGDLQLTGGLTGRFMRDSVF